MIQKPTQIAQITLITQMICRLGSAIVPTQKKRQKEQTDRNGRARRVARLCRTGVDLRDQRDLRDLRRLLDDTTQPGFNEPETFRCELERCGDACGGDRATLWGMAEQSSTGSTGRRSFSAIAYPHQALTGKVIASAHQVDRDFGFGFLESVYRRALAVELRYRGVAVAEEVPYELFHRGVSVGLYRADLVAESTVMVEAKTGLVLDPIAPVQLLNCMCAARIELGLVLYFGPRGVELNGSLPRDLGLLLVDHS